MPQLPTDDAPLDTAANAVTRHCVACHYCAAAEMYDAGQPKLCELHAVSDDIVAPSPLPSAVDGTPPSAVHAEGALLFDSFGD